MVRTRARLRCATGDSGSTSLTKFALTHLRRHVRFYSCALLGVAVFFLTRAFPVPLRFVAAGNAFFVIYLFLISLLVFRFTPDDLRAHDGG